MSLERRRNKTRKKSTIKTTVRTHFYNKHSRRRSYITTQQRRVRERKCTVFLKSLYVCGTSEKINIIITIYLSNQPSSVMSHFNFFFIFIFFLAYTSLFSLLLHFTAKILWCEIVERRKIVE